MILRNKHSNVCPDSCPIRDFKKILLKLNMGDLLQKFHAKMNDSRNKVPLVFILLQKRSYIYFLKCKTSWDIFPHFAEPLKILAHLKQYHTPYNTLRLLLHQFLDWPWDIKAT